MSSSVSPDSEAVNPEVEEMVNLQAAFVEALIRQGIMGKVRAQLRAATVGLIRGESAAAASSNRPELDPATKLSYVLVSDFLQKTGLMQSHGVFEEEANLATNDGLATEARRHKTASALQLNLSAQQPLLVTLVAAQLRSGDVRAADVVEPQQDSPQDSPQADRVPSPDIETRRAEPQPAVRAAAVPQPAIAAGTAAPNSNSTSAPAMDDGASSANYTDDRSADAVSESEWDFVERFKSQQKNSAASNQEQDDDHF